MEFYSNIQQYGKNLLVRGYDSDGFAFTSKIPYKPSLYILSKKKTKLVTLEGKYVKQKSFASIKEANNFLERYAEVDNFPIYGLTDFKYTYIQENYSNCEYNLSQLKIVPLDIEVKSESGFPHPERADEEVNAITIGFKGTYYSWGFPPDDAEEFVPDGDTKYIKCKSEEQLLKKFLLFWNHISPDIVTGWYIEFFDIPYLVNRMNIVLGEKATKLLSPWKQIKEKKIRQQGGKESQTYELVGISLIDYLAAYKKFRLPVTEAPENLKLDTICEKELGEKKIDYSEVGTLHLLYQTNFPKFMRYNIKDTKLIDSLENELGLIEMIVSLAYDAGVNFNDTFTQVRMWDVLIHNELKTSGIVIPPKKSQFKKAAYRGAAVFEPVPGMYNWVVSYDLDAEYPHLIIQYNIGPETLVEDDFCDIPLDDMIAGTIIQNKGEDLALAANGFYFRKDKQSFLASMMERMYKERKMYKVKMLDAQQEWENTEDVEEKKELKKQITKWDNMQMNRKIQLNAAYGAIGNEWFRYYDIRLAEAITVGGQLSIKWIIREINEHLNKILGSEDFKYVIASDTDSIYLNLDPVVQKMLQKKPDLSQQRIVKLLGEYCDSQIEPFIDASYVRLAEQQNVYAQKMKMSREVLADKGIWTAKKRYVLNVINSEGVTYKKPKMKVVGLEVVRSSTPNSCRAALKNCLTIMLNDNEERLIEYIEEFKQSWDKMPIQDIGRPIGLNGLHKYNDNTMIYGFKTPAQVKGALLFNHHLQEKGLVKKYEPLKEGDKIKFVYLKQPNTIQSEVISFIDLLPEEFELMKYVDRDLQFEKAFLAPLKAITEAIGWNTKHVSTLERFFG